MVHEVTIITLKEEDVIGSVDEAVASDFVSEFILHVFLNAMEEVAADFLVLISLHLSLNDL